MEVTGHDDVVGLPLRLDGGTSAGLRTFVVTAGQSIALKVNVLYGNSKYSVSLRHLDGRGVEQSTSNRLVFTPDSGWRDRGDYYTTSVTSWNGSARVHTFNLAVDAATPPDFYALETQTGRKGGGEWAQDKEFYLQVVAPNSPPTVSVTEPAAGEVFYGDSMDIVISANASDSEGTVTKVEFFEGTTLLGEAVSSPYSFEWLAVGVGSYTLTAKATDDGGMTSTSGPVSITVENALDDDGDGVTNDQDSCSDTPSCATVDTEGCPSDSDGDAVHDGCDQCPDDPDKTEAGDCGCGLADADSDGDGVPDCIDNCIDDQNPEQADSDANGIGDACDTIAPNEGDGDDTGDDGADDEGDVDDDNDEDTDEDDAADDGDDNADDDCRHTGDEDEDPDDEDDDEDDGDDGSEADDVDNGDADDVADDDPDEVTEQEAPRRFGSGNASAPGMCGNGIALAMITSFLASLALRFTGKRRSF